MTDPAHRRRALSELAARRARRRRDESLCARDFLTWGDTRGAHRDFCIFVEDGLPECSRDYHPGPVPDDERLYEGTGIGALFGLADTERHVWQLAGWNVANVRRTDTDHHHHEEET